MPRLRDVLCETDADAEFRLAFRRDGGRAVVTGEVRARLALPCQRCLGPLVHQVDAPVSLALVSGMDEARELPERYDPLLITEPLLRLADLIEDELLLDLPQIPMHAPEECGARQADTGAGRAPERENPFAVLAALRRND
jgi:uncharacterized protein